MGNGSRIEKFGKMFIHIAQAMSYLIAFNAIIQATIAAVGPCKLDDVFIISVFAGIWLVLLFIYEYYRLLDLYGSNTVKNKGVKILAFLLELVFAIPFYVLLPVLGSLLAAVLSARTNKEIASISYLLSTSLMSPLIAFFIGIIGPFFGLAFSTSIEELRKPNKMFAKIRIIAFVGILIAFYIIIEIALFRVLISFYLMLNQYCR